MEQQPTENQKDLQESNLETSKISAEVAIEKYKIITDENFTDFAVRAMSLREFEKVLQKKTSLRGKEVFMPNHSYQTYPGLLASSYEDELNEITPTKNSEDLESFNEYLHHDQNMLNKENDLARRLMEMYGSNVDIKPDIPKALTVKEDWAQRIQSQTSDSFTQYDVIVILDIKVIGKPNFRGGNQTWGYIHHDSDGKDIIGLVILKQDKELEEKVVSICLQGGSHACPVFNEKGELIFPVAS
jgi:hypothetical protein